ncbi:MAG: hypothetical protein Q4G23_11560, partial [Clostridia bacterium]|nr:hypothetical protein [Clostridia bacterium]
MKKIISLLLTFALLFTVTAFAEENEKMKEVLLSVKERIPDTEEFENFESSERTRNGVTSYNFMWYSTGDDYKEMSVRVTESGIITSYNFYKNEKRSDTPSVNKPLTKDFL